MGRTRRLEGGYTRERQIRIGLYVRSRSRTHDARHIEGAHKTNSSQRYKKDRDTHQCQRVRGRTHRRRGLSEGERQGGAPQALSAASHAACRMRTCPRPPSQ
eukprot:scaffold14896_cov111-Isochrysis_galbana.AAC.12